MNEEEYTTIVSFLSDLLTAADIHLSKLRYIKPVPGSNYIGNQFVYWDNVASGLRWAIQLAAQQRLKRDAK